MSINQQWRFPSNNYDVEKGLDTADMETFKKDPISSLAREICQNSIDARRNKNRPVKVEFSLFSIDSQKIPGIERLKQEIESCKNYWAHSPTIKNELENMQISISRNRISCLRISDFNTTGLVGVSESLSHDKPWYLLTKGSGISLKEGTTGGSKGIGKFSTFVASSFNTVFYATKTQDGEEGFQGIAKFASTNSIGNPEEKTSGNGYYSSNDKNQPILEKLKLDKTFKREDSDYGTDVYILGFDYHNWESSVISKILESFMVAIVRDHLEVSVSKQEINSKTIENIINKKTYIRNKDSKMIHAQYELLTSKKIFSKTFDFEDYGSFELMIKGYNHQDVNNAINNCLMIRYPYMKIRSFDNLTHIPHSALCIIGDNMLNQTLRNIENPQHTDWEINRVKDGDQKKIINELMKNLKWFISNEIKNYLLESDHQESDIEGAGDYLPDKGDGENGAGEEVSKTHTSRLKENKPIIPIGHISSEDDQGLEIDTGENDEDGDGKHYHESDEGHRQNGGTTEDGKSSLGSETIFNIKKLEGLRYRFFISDKQTKTYTITFNSPIDEEKCVMRIYALDDMNNKRKLNFLDVKSISNYEIKNGDIYFKLSNEVKYNFTFKTDYDDKFSAEVILYAVE